MNFGSGGNQEAKAWKDIWGCGQGIGAIKKRGPVSELVDRFEREYKAAIAAVSRGEAFDFKALTATV